MIRINLLSTNPGAPAPKVLVPPEQRSALIGLAMLVATAMTVGGWWSYQNHLAHSIDTRIAAVEAELKRLALASKVVDETLAHKAELAERLSLIERLRAAKREPVTLLETVSRGVTDGLWLLEMKQAGSSVQVEGRAMSLTAITDFVERLQRSGVFKHPVEILTTLTETVDDVPVVRFSIKADAVPPAPLELPGDPGTGAAAPRSSTAAASPTRPGA